MRNLTLPTTFAACLATLLLLVGCNYPGQPNPADRPVRSDEILNFAILYAQNCAGCHGANGKLGPAPPLNDPMFLAIISEAELSRVIREGRTGTPMPACVSDEGGTLTDAQVQVLVAGLRTHWKPAAAANEPPYLLSKPTLPGDTAAVERGRVAFARACAECHGATGGGGDGGGAINDPNFLALISDQALRRIIITGRADLGMPAFNDNSGRADTFQPLTSAEIDDLVALLAAWRAGTLTAVSSK